MKILTPLQTQLLHEIAQTSLQATFFLTGGTTLSAFYLEHRLSEDLDFFTEAPGNVPQVLPILNQIASTLRAQVEIRRQFATYLEVFLHGSDAEILKVDFAVDSPFRHQPTVRNEQFGIFIDNALDIACNKLSALFDRAAMKDFVDVYFIDKELFPFGEILAKAKEKHVGLDDYWLAVSLLQIRSLSELPHMIKPLEVENLRDFYLTHARRLMKPGERM